MAESAQVVTDEDRQEAKEYLARWLNGHRRECSAWPPTLHQRCDCGYEENVEDVALFLAKERLAEEDLAGDDDGEGGME